ncbi:MAG: Na/Pi cotransporter family protein [Firmicutes bacterium]|nr:Na/Pi cotransporter family protein [Bacillota bacterium]
MDIFSWFTWFGGLAFFLYGMNIMSEGLERQSGNSLSALLEKMTSNPIKGVLLGAAVTAVIQSSSATTVMVVGFVNSGIMKLRQALSIIMGANIGTTITAWFLSLISIDSGNIWVKLLKPSSFSPIIAVVGIFLFMFTKSQRKRDIGAICLGFALLMFGMDTMSDAVAPLSDMPEFANLLLMFQNPLLGLLMGMVMTAVIQSSSASVGILQALTISGAVTYGAAIPIILGQNIGTCVTAMLSSIGTNKNARRAALGHLFFNIIGAAIFMVAFYGAHAIIRFDFFDQPLEAFHVAIIHSIFNVTCTLVLLPFLGALEKLVCTILKDEPQAADAEIELLDERLLEAPGVGLAQAEKRAVEMGAMGRESLQLSFDLMSKYDKHKAETIETNEDRIDTYEDRLGTYLVKLSGRSLSATDSRHVSKILHTISDFERIGDHTCNLLNSARELHEKKLSFSEPAIADLQVLQRAVEDIMELSLKAFETEDIRYAVQVEPMEEVIDVLCDDMKNRHIDRMQRGLCSLEKGFIYLDVLTNLERISDHCSNLAVCIIELQHDRFETHEYMNKLKSSGSAGSAQYMAMYEEFLRKYPLS